MKHYLLSMLFALLTFAAFSQLPPPTYGTFSFQGAPATTCVSSFDICLGVCHTTAAGTCNDINTICQQSCSSDAYNGSTTGFVDMRPNLVGRKVCYVAVQIRNLSGCGTPTTVVLYDPSSGIDIQPSPTISYAVTCGGCTYKLYYLDYGAGPYFYLTL